MKKEAKLVRANLPGFLGTAHLYELSEPLDGAKFVVVSKVNAMFTGWETYIFAADESGEVSDWVDLPGSVRGDYTHEEALAEAGYRLQAPTN